MPRIAVSFSAVFLLTAACLPCAPKFYDDDPLMREPPPLRVEDAKPRKISDWYDLLSHVLATPGEKQPVKGPPIPARDVNTLGEVMNGAWYEMRHYRSRMTLDALRAGPASAKPPSADGFWTVISAKTEGITPGFVIEDEQKNRYFLKFDPIRHPELATAADVISSKIFYALGYHVPDNFIVHFDRDRLKVSPKATFRDVRGEKRTLTAQDVGEILLRTPRTAEGTFRASASHFIPGKILNEYRHYGTRSDDPNDIIPHEHRRSMRGLHVFCAWLGHEDSRAINTLDTLIEEGGLRYVKHYLIDFGSTLGSASNAPNSPRSGFEQFFTWESAAKEFLTLGLYVPPWSRIEYPNLTGVGRFSADRFDAAKWTPEYPNPAFRNRLPEDLFWAARQVMNFTDEEIRAITHTGELSDPAAERYLAETLIRRRDIVGRQYLARPMQLDHFRVESGAVRYEDLAVQYGFLPPQKYHYSWSVFDNASGRKTVISGASSLEVPRSEAEYLALDMTTGPGNETPRITLYWKQAPDQIKDRIKLVGIDRVSK